MKKSIVILLHIGYWAIYLFLLAMIVMALKLNGPQVSGKTMGFAFLLSPLSVGATLPGILGFYVSYLFLFKRYLTAKKSTSLIGISAVIAIIISALTILILYVAFSGKGVNWTAETCFTLGAFLAIVATVHGVIGFVMQGFFKWFEDVKLNADLQKKNYDTELALLKSQINPHFLFNTINNIDMLIEKDAKKASEYLNKLSDIMRFMLYETKTEKIQMGKELTYIEKFIELQKIRTNNQHYINYVVNGDATYIMIPPMLFISFIENAFKHAENKKIENAINIRIDIENGEIRFKCENSYNPHKQKIQEGSGLGIELIQKRLNLMYPDKHTLVISNNNDLYGVELTLYSNDN